MNPLDFISIDAAEVVFLTVFGFFLFLCVGFVVKFLAGEVDRDRALREWHDEARRRREDHDA